MKNWRARQDSNLQPLDTTSLGRLGRRRRAEPFRRVPAEHRGRPRQQAFVPRLLPLGEEINGY